MRAAGRPLRLLIWDRTCRGPSWFVGLSHAWRAGRTLYGAFGRIDAGHGAATWAEALDWVGTVEPERPIAEIQFWGHGRWGRVNIAGTALAAASLQAGAPEHERLVRVRQRLIGPDALWWFRTCETFGTAAGHTFAGAWTGFFGCRAAGHTHVIGVWQSGLHTLAPGAAPDWPVNEGVPRVAADAPRPTRALSSGPFAPRTINFLQGRIPARW